METTEAVVVSDSPPLPVVEEVAKDDTLELPLPIAGDLMVVARNPAEMVQAQANLLKWAIGKVALERARLTELEALLAKARSMKQRISAYSAQVSFARGTVLYYEKIQAAIEAGYCIVPNFPIQFLMVRTNETEPEYQETDKHWTAFNAVQPMTLPIGEGRYVDPNVATSTRKDEKEVEGKKTVTRVRYVSGFRDPELPARFAKMTILDDLSKAQKRGIFDAIGMLPTVRRPTDPMLIGQIRQMKGASVARTISFMIAWWIDTTML